MIFAYTLLSFAEEGIYLFKSYIGRYRDGSVPSTLIIPYGMFFHVRSARDIYFIVSGIYIQVTKIKE